MLRQFQAGGAQHLGAVDHRMHEQVLRAVEMTYLVPGELAPDREHVGVADGRGASLVDLLVHVVGNHQIGWIRLLKLSAQVGHDGFHRFAIEPVVGIDHLEIHAGGIFQAGVHRAAMAFVLLMNRAHDARMLGLQAACHLERVVLGGAVVNQKNFDIVAAGQQRIDAFLHVFG